MRGLSNMKYEEGERTRIEEMRASSRDILEGEGGKP